MMMVCSHGGGYEYAFYEKIGHVIMGHQIFYGVFPDISSFLVGGGVK